MSHQYTGSSLCWFVAAGHDQILQPPQLFHQRPATHTHIHTHTHTHAHTRTHTHTHKRTHAQHDQNYAQVLYHSYTRIHTNGTHRDIISLFLHVYLCVGMEPASRYLVTIT